MPGVLPHLCKVQPRPLAGVCTRGEGPSGSQLDPQQFVPWKPRGPFSSPEISTDDGTEFCDASQGNSQLCGTPCPVCWAASCRVVGMEPQSPGLLR